jgi:hypothetical protein
VPLLENALIHTGLPDSQRLPDKRLVVLRRPSIHEVLKLLLGKAVSQGVAYDATVAGDPVEGDLSSRLQYATELQAGISEGIHRSSV